MRRKQIILIVASTAIFFEALDIAILNLAIPLMQKSFTSMQKPFNGYKQFMFFFTAAFW